MTDAEYAYWQQYIREQADRLGLRDWDIRLLRESPSVDSADATFSPYGGQKRADIRFAHDWATQSREDQRHVVAHELIHAHTDAIDTVIYQAGQSYPADYWSMVRAMHRNAMEFAIDALANSIAPFLPLPETEEAV